MLFARFFRDHKGGVAPSSRLAGTVNWNNAKLRVALALDVTGSMSSSAR
jgi:hypothetical protein